MPKSVLVGLSGGVDSAVCALILKKAGYNVIGATMAIWGENMSYVKRSASYKKPAKDACLSPNEEKDINAAIEIAKKLDIEHYVFDCSKEYEKNVLENFKSEYLCGRTPNPCVRCNSMIKFGVLPFYAKNKGIKFDKFATGHYARMNTINGRFFLSAAVDLTKDQSYFLYRLNQKQLEKIMFPLGELKKETVRKIARENNLFVADKKDSQDFYDGDYNELINADKKIGNIVDLEGKILGNHEGIWNYTLGQRKGLYVSSCVPLYVVALKKETNEVVVAPVDETFKKGVLVSDLIFQNQVDVCKSKKRILAKIRSSGNFIAADLSFIDKNNIKLEFLNPEKSPQMGQSAVFYENDILLGGGIIQSSF
ncbi:MAG: tRNA 2-thiouridine(34) synthase MnmA [Candidatus Gastranaerophilales bacterium]|nr:tRNA 2-thiouridine(34) synthase MnmA [Candidatus Gastranaerophilales bacterium]